MKLIFSIFAMAIAQATTAATLDIYFIDVEGGQATLVVTPTKETLLIDSGFPSEPAQSQVGVSSSAQRIVAAAREAGIKKIDYLLITHFHRDHVGGVPELAQLLPIGTFIDYDAPVPDSDKTPASIVADALDIAAFEAYAKVRVKDRHIQPKPGDRLPLRDFEVAVVSANRSTLDSPLAGAGALNTACGASALAAGDVYENPRSNGILLKYGTFRFLDLGDLSGQPLFDLVCPTDRIGPVDVYLVAHHGGPDVADPATFAAFQPRVSVINNGATKGGAAEVIRSLRQANREDGTWQLHRAARAGAENVADERIANLSEQTAHWIKVSAKPDGSFSVLNGRTGIQKDYASHTATSVGYAR